MFWFLWIFLSVIKHPPIASGCETNIGNKAYKNHTAYYIDPNGDDKNTGTSAKSAWKTLSKVSSVTFYPGDSILLKSGGVWNETLQPKGSGKAGMPIVIDKYGTGKKPLINGGGEKNNSSTLLLDKVSFWEINNLEITNTVPDGLTYAATGIRVNGGNREEVFCTNITIKNCYVHHVNAATAKQPNYIKGTGGIILHGKLSNVVVESCHIAHCSVEALRTTGFSDMANRSKNIVFNNNLIENIYGDGIVMANVSGGCSVTNNTVYNACMTNDINFAGIWTVASVNTLISHNEVYGMKGGGPNDGMAFDADGWDEHSATDGDIFEYNYSHDNNGGFFLFMSHSDNITVRYNLSENDIGLTGRKKLFLIENSSRKNRYVHNNVFYIKNPVHTLFWKGAGAEFSNNIFHTTAPIKELSDIIFDNRVRFNNNCFYPSKVFEQLNWGNAIRNNNFYDDLLSPDSSANKELKTARGYGFSFVLPGQKTGISTTGNDRSGATGKSLPAERSDVAVFLHTVKSLAGSSLAKERKPR